MEVSYFDEVATRLRHWRFDDPSLYQAAETQLRAIKASPHTYGIDGTPHVPRLVTFGVRGRGEQYVITWEVGADVVSISSVCSVTEMRQRARLRRG